MVHVCSPSSQEDHKLQKIYLITLPHRLYLQKKKSKKNKEGNLKNKQCFNPVL